MSERWIKLALGFCDDEKIKIIRHHEGGDTFVWIWLWLLTTAMKKETDTLYIVGDTPYDAPMIALQADVKVDAVFKALDIFTRLKMITITKNGGVHIVNWHKHQSMAEMLDRRECNRVRKAKERALKRAELGLQPVTRDTCDSHTTEKRREEERREEEILAADAAPADAGIVSDPVEPPADPEKPPRKLTRHQRLGESFASAFREAVPGEEYAHNWPRDNAALKALDKVPEEEVVRRMRAYFHTADDRYHRRTVPAFVAHWNDKELRSDTRRACSLPGVDTSDVTDEMIQAYKDA